MVRIVADAATDFPESLAVEYNVRIVPAKIWFGNDLYTPGVNLTSLEFYEMLKESDTFPRTIPASPKDFYEAFREDRTDTLVLDISRKLSNFYESATIAKNRFNMNWVHLYDTGSVSAGAGLLVLIASKMARLGYTVHEIIKQLNSVKAKVNVYSAAYTLKYLVAGGRLPAYKGLIGGILKKKPIIKIFDGETAQLGTASGFENAIDMIHEMINRDYNKNADIFASVIHSGNQEAVNKLSEIIHNNYNVVEYYESRLGSAVGAHLGPGAVGAAICPAVKFE